MISNIKIKSMKKSFFDRNVPFNKILAMIKMPYYVLQKENGILSHDSFARGCCLPISKHRLYVLIWDLRVKRHYYSSTDDMKRFFTNMITMIFVFTSGDMIPQTSDIDVKSILGK